MIGTAGVRVLLATAALLALLVVAAGVRDGAVASAAEGAPRSIAAADATYQGKSARWWAKRAVQARKDANARGRTIRRLKAELRRRHEASSLTAIALASTAYRVDHGMLVRKARCETGGTFSPFAANPRSSARGLFQFLTSPNGGTWATTPYARFSVFDPYANALAAGWMHSVGRGREWECR
ncbi:MAG TPA: hypothetical protein VM204_09200 [Gaiellaceae bacterium]|nr:hypothetical protein [Gaiellaceae bacterium]